MSSYQLSVMECASNDKYRNEYLTAMGKPPYADILARIVAFMIDCFFILLVIMIFWVTLSPTLDQILGSVAGVMYAIAAIVFIWSYEVAFLCSRLQATPGKIVMRIKVVDMAGKRLSPAKAMLRSLVKFIPYLFFLTYIEPKPALVMLVGIIDNMFILSGENRRSFHDMVAGTVVINDIREKQF